MRTRPFFAVQSPTTGPGFNSMVILSSLPLNLNGGGSDSAGGGGGAEVCDWAESKPAVATIIDTAIRNIQTVRTLLCLEVLD